MCPTFPHYYTTFKKLEILKNFRSNNNYKYLNIYSVSHYYTLKTLAVVIATCI